MESAGDKKRFSVVLFWLSKRMLSAGGQPKQIDAPLQADYFEALRDIRIERIEWAARHLFATSQWFPMPVEMRRAAMLAPSTVLPLVGNNQRQIAELTEDQVEKNKQMLDEILAGFERGESFPPGDGPVLEGESWQR